MLLKSPPARLQSMATMFLPPCKLRAILHTAARLLLLLSPFILLLLQLQFHLPAREPEPLDETPSEQEQQAAAVRTRLLSTLPPCARNATRARTFLLLFMGHSGSTALITSLQQHSDTHITSLEPVDHGAFLTDRLPVAAARALNYSNHFFANGTAAGKTVGFKIRPRLLLAAPQNFSRLLAQYDTRIVWNFRANMFKQALGDYVIHYKGDKSAYEGLRMHANGTAIEKKDRVTSFRIHDMDFLHRLLKSRVSGDRVVANALGAIRPDGCVLPVSYESYLRAPELALERVQAFLGLDTAEMHPSLRAKATKDSMCDLVENWDELCAAFFGCSQWRWMLDDFENGCSCSALSPSRFKASQKYCAIS